MCMSWKQVFAHLLSFLCSVLLKHLCTVVQFIYAPACRLPPTTVSPRNWHFAARLGPVQPAGSGNSTPGAYDLTDLITQIQRWRRNASVASRQQRQRCWCMFRICCVWMCMGVWPGSTRTWPISIIVVAYNLSGLINIIIIITVAVIMGGECPPTLTHSSALKMTSCHVAMCMRPCVCVFLLLHIGVNACNEYRLTTETTKPPICKS